MCLCPLPTQPINSQLQWDKTNGKCSWSSLQALFLKIPRFFFTFPTSNRSRKNSGASGPVQLEKSKRAPGFPGSSLLIFRGSGCLCSLRFHENDVFIKAEKWTLGLMGSAEFPRPPAGMGVPGSSPTLIPG